MDLSNYQVIDQHAHNVLFNNLTDRDIFLRAFSEAHAPEGVAQARQTFFYRRSLRDLGELLGCESREEVIWQRRAELGMEALMHRSLDAAGMEMLLLDDGFLPEAIYPLDWHSKFVRVRRLLRTERVAEELLQECDTFEEFEDRFKSRITSPGSEVVGYKSIVCYRSGLEVESVSREEARQAYLAEKKRQGLSRVRLTNKRLLDYLLGVTLEIAGSRQLPVQLHTGFGDPDLDLRLANPLHLRRILEQPMYRRTPIVLLHAGYPFVRETGYLASVYPQVYVDCGLTIPFLSVRGMGKVLGELLELAPWTKVLYSSDAHFLPEMYYLGAKWGRLCLASVLEQAVEEGDLTVEEAEMAAEGILAGNARALYALGGTSDG